MYPHTYFLSPGLDLIFVNLFIRLKVASGPKHEPPVVCAVRDVGVRRIYHLTFLINQGIDCGLNLIFGVGFHG